MQKTTVLLVEDDVAVGEMLREQLADGGFDVEHATTLPDAEKVFANIKFDALLLDGTMEPNSSEVDTVGFLRRVKQHGFDGKVIGISGSVAGNCVLCLNGADAGVLKTRVKEILELLRE